MKSLGTLIAAALAALSAISWAWLAARAQRGDALIEYRPRRPVPWTGGDLCLVVLIFLFANVLASACLPMSDRAAVSAAADDPEPEFAQHADDAARLDQFELKLAAGATANLIALVFAAAWLVGRRGAALSDFGLARDLVVHDVAVGVVGFVAVSLPVYALQFLLSHFSSRQHPIIETLGQQPDDWLFLLSGLSAVAVAPVAEEFFFRVLLQGWLESLGEAPQPHAGMRIEADPEATGLAWPSEPPAGEKAPDAAGLPARTAESPARSAVFDDAFRSPATDDTTASRPLKTRPNPPWDTAAIFLTSLVFALLHVGQGWAPVPLFFLSLALGWLYQRTHRLLPSLVVHVCLNGCSLLMLRMASG